MAKNTEIFSVSEAILYSIFFLETVNHQKLCYLQLKFAYECYLSNKLTNAIVKIVSESRPTFESLLRDFIRNILIGILKVIWLCLVFFREPLNWLHGIAIAKATNKMLSLFELKGIKLVKSSLTSLECFEW